MKTSVCMLAVVAGLAAASQAQVNMTLLKTIDTSSTATNTNTNFVGSNVSGIAWNGTDLYVAGYNASGATANAGMAKLSNALGAGTWSNTFGAISTPNSRGFSSLAIKGNTLLAGWESGAGNVNSVRGFNATALTQSWATGGGTPDASRRGSAVAFDPGFNAGGTNVGASYLSIGSGRRHVMDASTGAYINGQNAGDIINEASGTSNWRGMAFDSATGDLYARESNRVFKAVRTADNSFAASTILNAYTTATTIDNQNIAFMNITGLGKVLIANDRSATSGGQVFTSVIKITDTNGVAQTINWNGFVAANGNGAYNFSFDQASQTLAISDFANRQVYIFAVPTPGTAALLGLGGLLAARRRRA